MESIECSQHAMPTTSMATRDPARAHVERPHAQLVVERGLTDVVMRWPATQAGPSVTGWCLGALSLLAAPLILLANGFVAGGVLLLAVDVIGFALIRKTSVLLRVERGLFATHDGQRFDAMDVKSIVVRRSYGAFQVIADVHDGFLLTRHKHIAYVRDASLAEAIASEARALVRAALK